MVKEGKLQIVKYAPPPPDLPILGKHAVEEVSFIGRTNYAAGLEEKKHVFGIKRADRLHHTYIIGKSGMGKSKLIELLMRQDIAHGRGVCLIDPRGEIIRALLDFIPESRKSDVCIINPSDDAFPVRFNLFAEVDASTRHQLAQGLIEIMKRELGSHWTVRTEHVFRFSVLAVLELHNASFSDVLRILTDREYRIQVCARLPDGVIKNFWTKEFDSWVEKFDAEAILPLVNRLESFFSNPFLRPIFSDVGNSIHIRECIERGGIIFIDLAKGNIGDENANMFGSLFVLKLKLACASRATSQEGVSEEYYCYIDEFQNLVTDTFEQLLNDAAKYGLCLTLSHQYLSQLGVRTQSAVLGNIGNIIVFRVGGEDAERLEAEMTPIFKAKDMINLGLQEFYIKMTIDGETHDPFSAETLKILLPTHHSFAKKIIEESRRQYAHDANVPHSN